MCSYKRIKGTIIHCNNSKELEIIENGEISIDQNGKIIEIISNPNESNEENTLELTKTQILIPGLIDGHIHAPQYPNCGLGYDKTLLDWLESYTFKLEKQYNDLEFSRKVYEAVVEKSLAHGTTTACYFGSLFLQSTLLLAQIIKDKGQRALVGKINMNTSKCEGYTETTEESLRDTKIFIEEIKKINSPLIHPVITPRFALSVDKPLMKILAQIAIDQELHVQTHISENRDELRLIQDIYQEPYANVYDEAGLLTSKTILAHGIYLNDNEIELIKTRGSNVIHCPESNTCLRSGLCKVRKLQEAGINVGLGTDVSGGPSPSIVSAMRSALETAIHISFTEPDYQPFNYTDVFYMATLGGAKALSLDHSIGNFVVGKKFDALVVDVNAISSAVDLLTSCCPSELLQKFIYTGDDRNVLKVFVDGKLVKNLTN